MIKVIRPNPLTLFDEVPNLIPNYVLFKSCGHDYEAALYNLRFNTTSEEYCGFVGIAPKDLLVGSDIVVKLLWCPWLDNTSGSAKGVLWKLNTNHAKYPDVLGAKTEHPEILGIIPDGEARLTTHLETFTVITGVEGGEHLSLELRRRAGDVSDTYTSDAVVLPTLILEYTSTLIKKK